MASRCFAIGDIHGCARALEVLLECIAPTNEDTIVTLGDYVDRGPNSPEVLDLLLQLQGSVVLQPLMGNHERLMLLALEEESEREFWLRSGGYPTAEAYGSLDAIPATHLEFLRSCLLTWESDTDFFVHANYSPSLPLDQQSEMVLLWEHLTTHFPEPHFSGKRAIVGHTPQRHGEPLVRPHLIDLDTFCYGGGWLTALEVTSGRYWQVNKWGDVRGNQPRQIEELLDV